MGGLNYHAQAAIERLEETYPQLDFVLATAGDAGEMVNDIEDMMATRNISALVVLPFEVRTAHRPGPVCRRAGRLGDGGRPRPQPGGDRGSLRRGRQPGLRPHGRRILRRDAGRGRQHRRPARHPDDARQRAGRSVRGGDRRLRHQRARHAARQLEPRRRLQRDAGLPVQVRRHRRGVGGRRRHGHRRARSDRPGRPRRTTCGSSAARA